jgi:hypothetical protein
MWEKWFVKKGTGRNSKDLKAEVSLSVECESSLAFAHFVRSLYQ